MRRLLLPFLTLVLAAQPAEQHLREDIAYLCSPALAGRGNGSDGLEQAATYLARSYRELGLTAQVQRFPFLSEVKRDAGEAALGGKPLVWGKDLEAAGFSADADLREVPLRFVGCGLKSGGYDDLVDLKGQAAVIFRKVPEAAAFVHLKRMETSLPVRIQKLEAAGAVLVIVVEDGAAPHPLVLEEGPSKVGLPVLSMPAATLAVLGDLAALRERIKDTGLPQQAPVPVARLDLKVTLRRIQAQLPNLAVTIPGTDPKLSGEVIAVGCHMDHLGDGARHSMGGEAAKGQMHPGADDNASGAAMVLDLARFFKGHPLPRPILLLTFSGEEEGLLGSAYWVQHPTIPLPTVKFMVNLDMVGRLDPAKPTLMVGGLGAPKDALEKVKALAPEGVTVGTDIGASVGGSDHMSFSAARIPTFFFFTGLHRDYHRPSDTADKINYPGMVAVEGMVERVMRQLADGKELPAFDPETAKIPASKDASPMNVAFGSIPDYTENPLGFRINGVSIGGTAEAVGMKSGDIIVKFGTVTIKNIYDYMSALGTYKPGDKVVVKWLRDGKDMQAEAVLKGPLMEIALPEGFPTRVFVEEEPTAGLLPEGVWTLIGDEAVRGQWRAAGLPEPPGTLWVPVREETKRLAALIPWLEAWAAIPLHRSATIVAVGGGVLTDMAGLASALYMRGLAWQAWPTTLLSQVDAGLGGKTAVDLEAGKNLAGAFHPPARFVACRSFLATLPGRELASGTWELFKMAVMEGDLGWAETLLEPGIPASASLLRALAAKAMLVHRDPREAGERRLLNLGHTLGHALEAASGYRLLHGEAVGLGTLAACFLAEEQGLPPCPPRFLALTASRLRPLLSSIPSWEACLPLLRVDKKSGPAEGVPGGTAIHCILPRPGATAEQRLLAPDAWQSAHARMITLLTETEMPQ